jgi:Ca-activated chloride channel family protein
LLIISDGQDNDSRYFFKQVREALKESNVLVYSMNITNYPGNVGSTLQQDGQEILKQLSAVSGGMSYDRVGGRHLESRDAASVLEIIATELRNQYTIAIEPSGLETEAGKWHKLKLRIAAPDKIKLSTRTREGFYGHHRLD